MIARCPTGAGALLEPVMLGRLELPHRIVMAPMTRNRAGEGNAPRPLNVRYYRQRASAALIITEATQVAPRGVGYPKTPGIHTDAQEAGWREVVAAVHEAGGRIFCQLWHVGRISLRMMQPDGALPVAPSAVRPDVSLPTPEGEEPAPTPRALQTREVEAVVDAYAAAAGRADRAGFDGVELHAANGYLVDQFLRDGTNRRTDRYGGSVENRVRFLHEVVEALAVGVGPERVGVRLSPLSGFNDMRDSDPARTFGFAAARLDDFGLAYLHLVEPERPKPPVWEEGETGRVFRTIRAAWSGVLMANGGYGASSGARAVASGYADLVSYGKLFLANPDLPRRLAGGLSLNELDPDTFYGGDAEGYVDYPFWSASESGEETARASTASGTSASEETA